MKSIYKKLYYSFFIQIFFNYHTMLSVGSVYLLDKLIGKEKIPRAVRLRLIIFFNGNPYIVPYAIAAISKEIKNTTDENKINKFIDSVVTMLGAVGDKYYWNSLKPVVLLFPITVYLLSAYVINYTIIASVISFLTFNILQLKERKRGLELGEKNGFLVIKNIKEIKSRWVNLNFSSVAFFLILFSLIFYLIKSYNSDEIFLASLIALTWGMISGKRGGTKKYYLLATINYLIIEYISL